MFQSLKDAVASVLGSGQRITEITGVSGGDINRAYRLTVSDGARLFMKCNAKANLSFFLAETEGLDAIASAGAIRTPTVLGVGTDAAIPFARGSMARQLYYRQRRRGLAHRSRGLCGTPRGGSCHDRAVRRISRGVL